MLWMNAIGAGFYEKGEPEELELPLKQHPK